MTTVYVNIVKGIVYTDSRCTTECVSTESLTFMNFCLRKTTTRKVMSFDLTKKVFAVHNSAVVTLGDVKVSSHLKELFESGSDPFRHAVPKEFKYRDGKILIVRPGYVIATRIKNGILEKNVYFNDNLTSGTGSEHGFLEHAQAYLWQLPEEKIFQVLRLSSLFDVYSDDNIVCMKPEQYRI